MGHRPGWIAALGVVLMAFAIGAVGYNIGVSHGLAIAAPAAGAPPAGVPYIPYMWYRPWGFGFGFGPLFLVLLCFFVLRPLLWGGFYRRRWSHAHADGVPPPFAEWHRRAHEQMGSPNPPAPTAPPSRT